MSDGRNRVPRADGCCRNGAGTVAREG